MVDTPGIAVAEHWRNLDDEIPSRLPAYESNQDDQNPLTIVVQKEAEKPVESVGIERSDGALIIYLDGHRPRREPDGNAQEHDANLAEYIDSAELARICDELLNGINSDDQGRQEWLERRAP